MEADINSSLKSPTKVNFKGDQNFVSIIVPVYNEEQVIKSIIAQIQKVCLESNINFEIIVVDDGSTDQSEKIIRQIDGIRFYQHSQNTGYGSALKTGLRKSSGNMIVITDADGTYPVEMIPELVKNLNEYEMVVGARDRGDKNIAAVRKPMKWFIGKLANYLSETQIPDLNSGLRAFRKDIAMKFFQMFPNGFSFTTTITLAMHCNGFDVKYIPIKYGKRVGKSKISPVKDTINFFQLIYCTVMYFNPLKIFVPMAIIVFLIFMVFTAYDVFILENLTDKTLISFETFVQISIIGLIADLISKRILITK